MPQGSLAPASLYPKPQPCTSATSSIRHHSMCRPRFSQCPDTLGYIYIYIWALLQPVPRYIPLASARSVEEHGHRTTGHSVEGRRPFCGGPQAMGATGNSVEGRRPFCGGPQAILWRAAGHSMEGRRPFCGGPQAILWRAAGHSVEGRRPRARGRGREPLRRAGGAVQPPRQVPRVLWRRRAADALERDRVVLQHRRRVGRHPVIPSIPVRPARRAARRHWHSRRRISRLGPVTAPESPSIARRTRNPASRAWRGDMACGSACTRPCVLGGARKVRVFLVNLFRARMSTFQEL